MIKAVIISKGFFITREYQSLESAIELNQHLPGECLGYYDAQTRIIYVKDRKNEAMIEGIDMFKLQGLDIWEIRYL